MAQVHGPFPIKPESPAGYYLVNKLFCDEWNKKGFAEGIPTVYSFGEFYERVWQTVNFLPVSLIPNKVVITKVLFTNNCDSANAVAIRWDYTLAAQWHRPDNNLVIGKGSPVGRIELVTSQVSDKTWNKYEEPSILSSWIADTNIGGLKTNPLPTGGPKEDFNKFIKGSDTFGMVLAWTRVACLMLEIHDELTRAGMQIAESKLNAFEVRSWIEELAPGAFDLQIEKDVI
jgi:hypothetical protein